MKRRELTKDGHQWLVVQLPKEPQEHPFIMNGQVLYDMYAEWQAECTRLQNAFPPILTNGGFPEGAKDLEEKGFKIQPQVYSLDGWRDCTPEWYERYSQRRLIALPLLKEETPKEEEREGKVEESPIQERLKEIIAGLEEEGKRYPKMNTSDVIRLFKSLASSLTT